MHCLKNTSFSVKEHKCFRAKFSSPCIGLCKIGLECVGLGMKGFPDEEKQSVSEIASSKVAKQYHFV